MDFVLKKKTHKITGEIGYGIFPLKSYSYVKGQYFNHIYASAQKILGKKKVYGTNFVQRNQPLIGSLQFWPREVLILKRRNISNQLLSDVAMPMLRQRIIV